MKGFIYLFLFNISLLSSDTISTSTSNQLYIFTYMYDSPSLGLVNGIEELKVLMKNGNILSAWSLKTGLEYKDIPSFGILLDVINGNTQNLHVEYDNNNFPKKISLKTYNGGFGQGFFIEIKDFKFIHDVDYTIDIRKERMNEFKSNHQKWMKLNTKNYSYTYQDSREKDLNMEGIWVVVDNEKIIRARDIRSYEPIVQLENRSFLTIRKLFAIAKKRLEENWQISILYNEEYGYPYWIGFKNNKGDLRTIFSRNFRKEF